MLRTNYRFIYIIIMCQREKSDCKVRLLKLQKAKDEILVVSQFPTKSQRTQSNFVSLSVLSGFVGCHFQTDTLPKYLQCNIRQLSDFNFFATDSRNFSFFLEFFRLFVASIAALIAVAFKLRHDRNICLIACLQYRVILLVIHFSLI